MKKKDFMNIRQKNKRGMWVFLAKVIFLVFLIGLQTHYLTIFQFINIPGNIFYGLAFFLSGHLALDLIRLIVRGIYTRQKAITSQDNFLLGLNRIVSLGTLVVLALAVLLVFKVNIKELFTSLSIIAAALAILFKDYISNMVNGMILMFSNQISLGDYVKIGDK